MSSSERLPELFISYRREDSSGHAGRLFDGMRERFGDESIFMDVTDIGPGVDFAVALDSALSSCRVVLVVIGTQWLTCTDASGRRRLDDPNDHLRMEIVQALRREAHVIPVLVRGAAMPRERDLPDDLRPLARRQAQEVSDSRWSYDVEQLVRTVQNDLGAPGQGDGATRTSRSTKAVAAAGARGLVERVPEVDALRHRWVKLAVPAAVVLFGVILLRTWSGGERAGQFDAPSPREAGAAAPTDPQPGAPTVQFSRASGENAPAILHAMGEARAGDAVFKVLGGLVGRDDAGGAHTIRLFMRTTNVRGRYGIGIGPDSFRLIAGGRATPPDEAPIEVIAMQSASEGWVSFRVPANASAVVLQVGDIRQATAKIPIDLGSAAKDISEKPAPTWRYPVDIAVAFEKRVGPVVFNVDGIRLEHFADAVALLQPERLELSVKVRMRNVGAPYGLGVGPDAFRLLIDDVPLAPTKFPIQVLSYEGDLDAEVVFLMPGTATTVILQLGNLDAETVRVPLDLSPARLKAPR